ncbi:IS5 family transposase [Longispora fulva]|uniref:IS5 family transposase n=1 Tax=Longispora fulva TaxID=619741 RepID=A0A8J7GAW5_9ACTN|nr:IS5 family transposase [Longispora fulva]
MPQELLRLPVELAQVDGLLDDARFVEPFRPYFDSSRGRPSTPIDTYLRLMFLKFRYGLGYESLCREVADSISWRRFCHLGLCERVPHPTTLMKITTRCGDAAVVRLNEALLDKAVEGKVLRVGKVRADTTVVSANVEHPTDSGLLAKAVTKTSRLVRRIKAAGGAPRTRCPDRSRAAGRRARQIASRLRLRVGKDEAQQIVRRITGELADLAEHVSADADAVLRNAFRALSKARGPVAGRLRRAADELASLLARTGQIITQTRSRLAGVMPDSATRVISLHDVDARPIVRGRLGKPVEFGFKAQVVDNEDGIILDHTIELGNPADAPQLAPAIARIAARAGRVPRAVAADRGYGEARVEAALHDLGVRIVAIPRKGQPGPARQAVGETTRFPRPHQVAHRLRRTHQPPQTPIRMGPRPPRRPRRRPHLVRTRRLHPQPHQNQRPDSLNNPKGPDNTRRHHPNS